MFEGISIEGTRYNVSTVRCREQFEPLAGRPDSNANRGGAYGFYVDAVKGAAAGRRGFDPHFPLFCFRQFSCFDHPIYTFSFTRLRISVRVTTSDPGCNGVSCYSVYSPEDFVVAL